MKISYTWLKELVPIDLSIDEFCEKLTMFGLEVEDVTNPGKELGNIVVGKVIATEQHPSADKLTLCKVDVGQDEILDIICGAPNVTNDIVVPVALIGATIQGMEIKKVKLRGIESYGMICAEDELGISDDHSGIMILDESFEIGASFAKTMGLDDYIIEVEVTPNRPDLLGMIGVAREVAAMLQTEYTKPEITFEEAGGKSSDYIAIDINDRENCPRYCARMVKGIKVQTSPLWMQKRLIANGLRPINNIVDVTNYVLLEYGHPLHAFDYSKIQEQTIVVRSALNKEKMMLLDDTELTLHEGNLLIADKKHSLALAGIMGGLDSSINDETKDVLIECAYFNPRNIRVTALEYGLQTESSYRFERGMDPNNLVEIIDRAAQLMQKTGGGMILEGVVDAYPKKIEALKLPLRVSRSNNILNTKMSDTVIESYLMDLEFHTKKINKDTFEVTIPTFRPDIEREIDIIEELARCYGYDRIDSNFSTHWIDNKKQRIVTRTAKNHLISLGFFEVNNMSFASYDDLKRLHLQRNDYRMDPVELANPLGEQFSLLRTTLIPDLLKNAHLNLSHSFENFKLFELNRVYLPYKNDTYIEPSYLTGVIVGSFEPIYWNDTEPDTTFFDVKGVVESVFSKLRCIGDITYKKTEETYYKRGMGADVYYKDKKIGSCGILGKDTLESFDIEASVMLFDICLDKIIAHYNEQSIHYHEIVKYPPVLRDIAVIAPADIEVSTIENTIMSVEPMIIQGVHLFDVYTGSQIKKNHRSLAFNIVFQSENSTLTDKYVDKLFDNIVKKLSREHQIELRQE